MNDEQLLRYSRHILLPEIGIEGQEKLLAARALVIGVLRMGEQAGCREARLRTHTYPLAAIPLYLQLGFEPLVKDDSEREVWQRVIRLLS